MAAIKKFLNPCGDPMIDKLNQLVDAINTLNNIQSTTYVQPLTDTTKIDTGSGIAK
jgi:hypothetical protein